MSTQKRDNHISLSKSLKGVRTPVNKLCYQLPVIQFPQHWVTPSPISATQSLPSSNCVPIRKIIPSVYQRTSKGLDYLSINWTTCHLIPSTLGDSLINKSNTIITIINLCNQRRDNLLSLSKDLKEFRPPVN